MSRDKENVKICYRIRYFLAIFKFLKTGPHCENTKFYDSQAKRELKKYTQNVKPKMKAKFSATDQFFM